MAEILLLCNERKAKTRIMYKANLNYGQIQNQLKFLVSNSLLSCDQGKYAIISKVWTFFEVVLGNLRNSKQKRSLIYSLKATSKDFYPNISLQSKILDHAHAERLVFLQVDHGNRNSCN
jgi:hypothetical protein